MAKQGGIHKIRGKIGEASYYQSQVGGYLIRGINQGMSERVKNDPAFANTRLNATEFGGAGKLAGAMVSAVSLRWRWILSPVATGKLSSAIKNAMAQDTTNPWGEREVLLSQMDILQAAYSEFSKNQLPEDFAEFVNKMFIGQDGSVLEAGDGTLSVSTANEMLAKGIEGVQIYGYLMQVSTPEFDPAAGKYTTPRVIVRELAHDDIEVAAGADFEFGSIDLPISRGVVLKPQNVAGNMRGLLFVMLPYRVVNNQKYILQEHCACSWTSIPDGE